MKALLIVICLVLMTSTVGAIISCESSTDCPSLWFCNHNNRCVTKEDELICPHDRPIYVDGSCYPRPIDV